MILKRCWWYNYLCYELGREEIDDKQLEELRSKLQVFKRQLRTKRYRLLSMDNFKAEYGSNSDLLITSIDCPSWYEIAVYKNIYRR